MFGGEGGGVVGIGFRLSAIVSQTLVEKYWDMTRIQ